MLTLAYNSVCLPLCALFLFIQTLALYKSFIYLLTYLLTYLCLMVRTHFSDEKQVFQVYIFKGVRMSAYFFRIKF